MKVIARKDKVVDRLWSAVPYLCDFPFFLATLKKAKLTSISQTKYPTEQKVKNGMPPFVQQADLQGELGGCGETKAESLRSSSRSAAPGFRAPSASPPRDQTPSLVISVTGDFLLLHGRQLPF